MIAITSPLQTIQKYLPQSAQDTEESQKHLNRDEQDEQDKIFESIFLGVT
jgi:hypothetical protein